MFVMEGVFTGFVLTRPVLKRERLALNICIFWLQTQAKIYWHAHIGRYSTRVLPDTINASHFIQFEHNDKTNGLKQLTRS